MLVLLAGTAAYSVLRNGAAIWRQANENALNIALGLESSSSVVLAQPVVSLRGIRKDLAPPGHDDRLAQAMVNAMRFDPMSAYLGASPADGPLTVLTHDGPAPGVVVDALRSHLLQPSVRGLAVQQMIQLPGRKEWFLPITLASDGDGAAGFVFALIPASQLVAGADSLRLLPGSYVSFVASDGRRLLRYWKDRDALEVNGPPMPDDRLDVMDGQARGSFEMLNSISGQAQLAGFARSTVLPIVVATVVPTRELYLRWMEESLGPVLVLLMGMAGIIAYALRLRGALLAEAEVRQQALTDRLTALPNRRALEGALAQALAVAARGGGSFAVAMVDIDFFKVINDSFGHHAGDEVLSTFARRLHAALRAQDRAYRYGGEEFCVLLPATDALGACALAERLRAATALPATATMHAVTASFGVAVWEPGDDAVTLLARADDALYRAKAAGRNCVELA
jgi:diguanylate cyclase (GGDEF)-like protein